MIQFEMNRNERWFIAEFNSYLEKPISSYSSMRLVQLLRRYVEEYAPKDTVEIVKVRIQYRDRILTEDDIRPNLTLDDILDVVLNYFNYTREQLFEKKRKYEQVLIRQIFFFYAKQYSEKSLNAIAKHVGIADHTTVVHNLKRLRKDMDTNEVIRGHVLAVHKLLQTPKE